MNWGEVCEHPDLHNLPFKIELNENGQILMSPVKVYHSAYQAEIAYLLRTLSNEGKALSECAIDTPLGTKIADIAWASHERFMKLKSEITCSIAPEICIEVISSSNTSNEINIKAKLYFDAGAVEVWTCDKEGNIIFYTKDAKIEHSRLIPLFPVKLDI